MPQVTVSALPATRLRPSSSEPPGRGAGGGPGKGRAERKDNDQGPVVATLVLKAAGMARQRIQLTKPRRNLDFHYRRGVGHLIEYTDLARFHADEAALREIIRLPFNIRTVIGAIGNTATLRSSLVS